MSQEEYCASRRQFLQTLVVSGAIAASDLAWWETPFLSPRKASAASTVRFQFSVPEPLRISMVESLIARFHKTQSEVEVKVAVRYAVAHPDHASPCPFGMLRKKVCVIPCETGCRLADNR